VIAAAGLPILRTRRLTLRALHLDDAPALAAMLADEKVARGLIHVPHPLPGGTVEQWIRARLDAGDARFAIVRRGEVLGTVGLRIIARHRHAELGYWLGATFWGRGYAAEAARAVVAYGFRARGLRRVFGQYLGDNHASGRVMEKIGMLREGVRRRHFRKGNRWYDAHQFGILREDVSWRTTS
jgi:RimJ/RimL family protein N-acetyltransferase